MMLLMLTACDSGSQATPTATVSGGAATFVVQTPATSSQSTAVAPSPTAGAQATVSGTVAAGAGEFQNPVIKSDFPDPFVLSDTDAYYAYATNGSGENIQAARSTDLVHWTMLTDAMPALPSWAKLGGSYVWAPEVVKIGDKYVMYYVARDKTSNKQCVGVATADKPDGKFHDTNTTPLVCQSTMGGTIDPSPFRDGDKLYLYFKNDGNCCNQTTYLWAQELAPDGMSVTGQPTQLVHNDHAWEGTVVEAPTMWKQDGKYYLFFSANSYAGEQYAVGYAACDSPTGPCTEAAENPILKSKMDVPPLVIGPGGQSIVQDHAGNTWIAYHAWQVTSAGTQGSARNMWLDRLDWKDGKPVVDGPTVDPQPAPSGQ
jgi:beta-xylosidase